jgi:hypothetical protein
VSSEDLEANVRQSGVSAEVEEMKQQQRLVCITDFLKEDP